MLVMATQNSSYCIPLAVFQTNETKIMTCLVFENMSRNKVIVLILNVLSSNSNQDITAVRKPLYHNMYQLLKYCLLL